MPRYINDDAPITPNIRQAARITTDQLKQIMINEYNHMGSVKQCAYPYNPADYKNIGDALTDLMAVISYESQKVVQDRSNIDFDLENIDATTPPFMGYAGDQGIDLCGLRTIASGLTFCGAIAGGDWEEPLFYIIYYDGTDLRAYIPIKGNVMNCDTLSAFGSEVNLCNPNAPYNLMQLYNLYKANNLLVPSTTTLSEFVDGDGEVITDSYLKQYGSPVLTGKQPGTVIPNAGGFNWTAIAEELNTAIQVI